MKLIRYTYIRLFLFIFLMFMAWGVLFYISMMEEIMDETDDRLLNNKSLVVHRLLQHPDRLLSADTVSDNYRIRRISEQEGFKYRDRFYDTKIYVQIEDEYEPMRVYKSSFRDNEGQFYEIELYLSTIERDNVIENIFFYLILLFVLLLSIMLVGVHVVLQRTFRPLYRLLDWLNGIMPGAEVEELKNDTEIIEFRNLSQAALNMHERSRKVYLQQKDFIGNASHELQTPLAIALNKLDMLANSGQFNASQMQLLGEIFDTLQRATKLNKSLLLLSQIQNEQFIQTRKINLTKLTEKALQDLNEIYEEKELTVEMAVADEFEMEMNDVLATILINNMVKNAVLHSPAHSKILIKSTSDSLTFVNGGDTALDTEKIFKRFYRPTQTVNKNSTGLGLAIAQEISLLSGIKLSYIFDGNHNFMLKK